MVAIDTSSLDRVLGDIEKNMRHQTEMMRKDAEKLRRAECRRNARMIRFCREKIDV